MKANEKSQEAERRPKKGESAFKSDFEEGRKPKWAGLNKDDKDEPAQERKEKPKLFRKKKHLKRKDRK